MKNHLPSPDLELAFDVGHSSIGWSILQTRQSTLPAKNTPKAILLGCGVVTFGSDDCLASKRRDYRRQRRHARATRHRVSQIEKLLAHKKVISEDELKQMHQQAGGKIIPWLLAARVLASDGNPKYLGDWKELWEMLRWYAHNRGYDGNRRWSVQEVDAQSEDTEKEETANALMQKHCTKTMVETFCKTLGIEPLGGKQASLQGFRNLNAAFPRQIVEREVRRLLELHRQKLPDIDDAFIKSIFDDWRVANIPALKLPARYRGGLLFGQIVPRFDNRIISICPLTGEKVPVKRCVEFLRFRWAMILANIRVGHEKDRDLRPLTSEERKKVNSVMELEGALTPPALRKTVSEISSCSRNNLATMLMDPNAKEALILDPIQKLIRSEKLKTLWPTISPRAQKRVRDLWHRGKPVTLKRICLIVQELGESLENFEAELGKHANATVDEQKIKNSVTDREDRLKEHLIVKWPDGRAAYARSKLIQAYDEIMDGKHPKEPGGCLFITPEIRETQLQKKTDRQTNNHLVRHRLLLLERLLKDLINEPLYANGDKSRVSKITVEVNRDLRNMSGKTAKEIEMELGRRLSNHHAVAEKLAKDLDGKTFNGKPIHIKAGLIRKARIAEDLGWVCPYTGKDYDALDLVSRNVDKDHIIPRSHRASDSLESLVITFAEVNRMKGQRTALQFIHEDESKVVPGSPQLTIVTRKQFEDWVKALEARRGHEDDQKRKKKRKELLLVQRYEEKTFLPRDLTITSQLTRLATQVITREFSANTKPPFIVSLPGSVTGIIRKSWNLLGCLALAAPQVKDDDGCIKTKTDIRSITHLHHALDACVMGLGSHYLPNNGNLWELMIKRNPNAAEKSILSATGCFEFDSEGRFGMTDLDNTTKEQICHRLAEKRVVQHIPADMSGLKVEENTRGVMKNESGRVFLRQRSRDAKTRTITIKKTTVNAFKIIGLKNGKLSVQKGVRVITDNFGVAILDHAGEEDKRFAIVPWHKVWPRIQALKVHNGGKKPRILRIGTIISVPNPKTKAYKGIWMIRGVQLNQQNGYLVDISGPDVVEYRKTNQNECKQNVALKTLVQGGLQILRPSLIGVVSHVAQTQNLD